MDELRRLGAPVTIVSAGIEDIIFEVLRLEGIEAVSAWDEGGDPDLPRVYANRMRYDAEGIVVGCEPSPPATSENKHVAYHDMRPRFEGVERVLIVGDSCGDVQTAKAIPAQYLAVGFYDPANPWKGRDDFEKAYHVLFDARSSMASILELLVPMGQPSEDALLTMQ